MLALVLMIGFYALALLIAGALFWIPYAEFVYAHHITAKLAVICIIAGGTILWSVLPRRDRFVAPGPQLQRNEQPRLFQELEAVARATHQVMPAKVYLVPDVNAWVMQRGGVMGLGSRRVMGLGLPLMRILSQSQFRAVLAHEFGHYHGGDTSIGPWIYKTRAAISRTLAALGDSSWLQAPFRWYGNMFMRITHAVSRRQEFVADELAARTVGARPLIEGLRSVHRVAPAFTHYWYAEYVPVLRAGFIPPFADGFAQFVRDERIAANMDRYLEQQMTSSQSDPYDTHPPLKERIAALAELPPGSDAMNESPAVSLLEDVGNLERELMAQAMGADQAASATLLDWDAVGTTVYVPQWHELVQSNASALQGLTPEALITLTSDLRTFGKAFVDYLGDKPDNDGAEPLALAVVGAALTLLLIAQGARLNFKPGQGVSVELRGHFVDPFSVLPRLKDGSLTAAAWGDQCAELGIARTQLGPTANAVER
jgi:Zn-dependent protease with chaperone function